MKQAGGQKGRGFLQGRWALLGLALFMPALLSAASSSSILLRVRPVNGDVLPPTAVSDLQAFSTPNEGEVFLSWTAPQDNPAAATVSGYQIRYATYSIVGSTAAWWAAATPVAIPGGFTVQAPGQPQGLTVSPLAGGTTYYFAIRSFDAVPNFSALDTSSPQASARPRSVRPAPCAGLLSIVQPDTSVDLNWNPVDMNEDGTPALDVVDYAVRRSASMTGPFNVTVSSGAGASSFSVPLATAPATVDYLLISAVDASGNESDPALSNILEVTPQGIIGQLAVAQNGTVSRSYLPASMMQELRTANGDLLMRVAPNADPAMNRDPRTLATYNVDFVSAVQVVDKNFTLSRPAMNVVLQSTSPLTAGAAGVLWWNGAKWIKVGQASVDDITDTVSFYTALPGTYQIRGFQAATELTLDKANVFPRIFSPNGDGTNDEVLFVIDNPNGSAIDGKIYDVGGNEVGDLRLVGSAPNQSTYAWGGRDRRGQVVRAGVYIYRVKGEGKSITGTVVVTK